MKRVITEGDYGDEEGDCGDEEGDVCGFNCCRSCLDDHTCGDDPSEYY